MGYLIGIDQGTSGTTVLVVDPELRVWKRASRPVVNRPVTGGGMEQDPSQVLASVVESVSEAIDDLPEELEAAGLAHQGETVLVWDPQSLEPLTPAVVWSDRRAETVTRRMTATGMADRVRELSGTRLDSYLCAAKYRWLLDQSLDLAARAEQDDLQLGTLETWLILQLGGRHQTDMGTASRTQLTRLGAESWEPELLELFGLSETWLAPISPSLADKGPLSHPDWDRSLPLKAAMVDQSASLIGNGCLEEGDVKVTYGTGAFAVVNAGRSVPSPQESLIASVGWSDDAGPVFLFDGGVLSVGSALAWLADIGVEVGPQAHARLVGRAPSSLKVLPALSGTGAPHWERDATASISGITAGTDGDELLQGFLDSFAFRIREIIEAIAAAGVPRPTTLKVDGGLTRSAYLMQLQADVLDLEIAVSAEDEATALGIAAAAGWSSAILDARALVRAGSVVYEPVDHARANEAYQRWLADVYRNH